MSVSVPHFISFHYLADGARVEHWHYGPVCDECGSPVVDTIHGRKCETCAAAEASG